MAQRQTTIYLTEDQLEVLRSLGRQRGQSVGELVREALTDWLASQQPRNMRDAAWQRRFDALLVRRRRMAARLDLSRREVDEDVLGAVRESRTGQ